MQEEIFRRQRFLQAGSLVVQKGMVMLRGFFTAYG